MAISYIANIVDIDDFVGDYALSTNSYSDEVFDSFVTQKQYNLLIDMLGAGLYNTYQADPTNTEWTNLLGGESYTDTAGYTQNWVGLKYLMKPYIFALWLESDNLKAEQSGLIKPKFENATVATEYERKTFLYNRWNQFIDRYNECHLYIYTKNSNDSTKYEEYYVHWREKFKKGILTKGNIK